MSCAAADVIENFRTCEFTTLSRDGTPQTWPVCPLLLKDGRFLVCTSIGLPQKAFNIRRNPKVSMLFSEPTGSGVTEPGAVLIQGEATVEDRVVTDLTSEPDMAKLLERVFARQPAGAFMSTWLGRWLFPFYFMRIVIHVAPRRGWFWPTRVFVSAPQELDVTELSGAG